MARYRKPLFQHRKPGQVRRTTPINLSGNLSQLIGNVCAHHSLNPVCVPKTSSGDEFGSPALCRVAWRCFCRLGDAAIRKTWERTARTGLSESPLVLTGVYPLVWHVRTTLSNIKGLYQVQILPL